MKIINLYVQNIKGIKAVDITPDKNLVVISGKNGAGKTSCLDAIHYAFGGKSVIPEQPIKKGEKKANIEVDTGEFKVIRTFTDKGSYLKVVTKDGANYQKAQQKLDEWTNKNSFDPLLFSKLTSKEQKKMLFDLLGISLDDYEKQRKELYDKRRDIGVLKKQAEGEIAGMDVTEQGLEHIDIVEITQQISELRKKYEAIRTSETEREIIDIDIKVAEGKVKEAERLLSEAKEWLESLKKQKDNLPSFSEEDKNIIENEISKKENDISNAEENNEKVKQRERYKLLKEKKREYDFEYSQFTSKIEEIDNAQIEMIKSLELPVEGLGFNEDSVTLNEIPFSQISESEKIKTGMAIAMRLNPELRVIRIKEGSLIDEDGLKIIEEMCDKEDYQVWIERVESSSKDGEFYIEDGTIIKSDKTLKNYQNGLLPI